MRIWKDPEFQKQSGKFWEVLALHLKNHPAIVRYNILNEPHLEKMYDFSHTSFNQVDQRMLQEVLFEFYDHMISVIRIVDTETPIILDSSDYANPQMFKNLKPHLDDKFIYSFHMYEPFVYTNLGINNGKFTYPGLINGQRWDKKALQAYLQEVILFQKTNQIPSNRILVGEFDGHRTSKGLSHYFQDLLEIFKENNWHFAFYAFREDIWDGMDYELGDQELPWSYWQAIEKGQKPDLPRNQNYPTFKVLHDALK